MCNGRGTVRVRGVELGQFFLCVGPHSAYRELKMRGLAERILIVAPANLAFQWQRVAKVSQPKRNAYMGGRGKKR